jgi:type IV pilus assembly protein PilA
VEVPFYNPRQHASSSDPLLPLPSMFYLLARRKGNKDSCPCIPRCHCRTSSEGFTLIELLLVIAIITVLASIVVTAVNPSHQLSGARNAQRWSDVTTFLDGFAQYAIDHYGEFLPLEVDGSPLDSGCNLTSTPKKLCKSDTPHGAGSGQCGAFGEECVWTRHLSGTYLVGIPPDPRDDESVGVESLRVDYTIRSLPGKRIEVEAINAEQSTPIRKSR